MMIIGEPPFVARATNWMDTAALTLLVMLALWLVNATYDDWRRRRRARWVQKQLERARWEQKPRLNEKRRWTDQ